MAKRASSLISNEEVSVLQEYGNPNEVVLHHIMYGNGQRSKSDKYGCWCFISVYEHEILHGHITVLIDAFGKPVRIPKGTAERFDLTLKRMCQREFIKAYGVKKWVDVFGRNYL